MSDLIERLHTAAPKNFPLGALCHEAAAEIASLRSQLEEARRADEWRDISTAPKDGSTFLACGKNVRVDFFHWQSHGPHIGWRDSFIIVYPEEDNEITHWRPLPAPPALQSTDGKEVGG